MTARPRVRLELPRRFDPRGAKVFVAIRSHQPSSSQFPQTIFDFAGNRPWFSPAPGETTRTPAQRFGNFLAGCDNATSPAASRCSNHVRLLAEISPQAQLVSAHTPSARRCLNRHAKPDAATAFPT